jgi:hypothetical protein
VLADGSDAGIRRASYENHAVYTKVAVVFVP